MRFFVTLFLLILVSCNQKKLGPEEAIKTFVESSMGQVVTRDFVLGHVTGRLHQNFMSMSDEDFAKFADMRSVQLDNLKIVSKSCVESKCFVTYLVTYSTKVEDKKAFASDIRKIAEVIEVDGNWLIADISNIKTYHESVDPIQAFE